MTDATKALIMKKKGGSGGFPAYHGSYTVDPGTEQVRLSTARKSLEQDVIVNPIPIREEENEAGGITVSIG